MYAKEVFKDKVDLVEVASLIAGYIGRGTSPLGVYYSRSIANSLPGSPPQKGSGKKRQEVLPMPLPERKVGSKYGHWVFLIVGVEFVV